jgi:hypothetical protein
VPVLGTAEYQLRLSAFRFRFFLFFIVSRIERRSIRERYPGYVCEAAIAKNQAGTTTSHFALRLRAY